MRWASVLNNKQALAEIRKEFAVNERLADLVKQVAKGYADDTLRLTYKSNDAAELIRLSGEATGVEKFIELATATPKPARQDQGPVGA